MTYGDQMAPGCSGCDALRASRDAGESALATERAGREVAEANVASLMQSLEFAHGEDAGSRRDLEEARAEVLGLAFAARAYRNDVLANCAWNVSGPELDALLAKVPINPRDDARFGLADVRDMTKDALCEPTPGAALQIVLRARDHAADVLNKSGACVNGWKARAELAERERDELSKLLPDLREIAGTAHRRAELAESRLAEVEKGRDEALVTLGKTIRETATALGCEPDNEKILERADELRGEESAADMHRKINQAVSDALGLGIGASWHDLGAKIQTLRDRLAALAEAAREYRDLLKELRDLRVPESRKPDDHVFGMVDIYGFESEIKRLDALLANHPEPPESCPPERACRVDESMPFEADTMAHEDTALGCKRCLHAWKWHEGPISGCVVYSDADERCGCKRERPEPECGTCGGKGIVVSEACSGRPCPDCGPVKL